MQKEARRFQPEVAFSTLFESILTAICPVGCSNRHVRSVEQRPCGARHRANRTLLCGFIQEPVYELRGGSRGEIHDKTHFLTAWSGAPCGNSRGWEGGRAGSRHSTCDKGAVGRMEAGMAHHVEGTGSEQPAPGDGPEPRGRKGHVGPHAQGLGAI